MFLLFYFIQHLLFLCPNKVIKTLFLIFIYGYIIWLAWIIQIQKGVRTSDKEACGEVISSPKEEIFIVDGAVNIKKYKIPKSKIKFYNGSELVLQIPT